MKQPTIPGIGGSLCGELILDHFCGGGGASEGIEEALGRSPDWACNHDPASIQMHMANHPHTDHRCESIHAVDPRDVVAGRKVGLLWTSPACTHFSRARGSVPVSRQLRALGWTIPRWAAAVRPRVIIAENVSEWQTWGPVRHGRPVATRAGDYWRQLLAHFDRLGYAYEVAELDAADYGAATHRRRLIVIARCDGLPILWPEPTHGPGRAHAYAPAAGCIDWSDLGGSILHRAKPLAPASCRRIAAGVMRYVVGAASPFLAPVELPANDAGPGLASAWLAKYYGGVVGQDLRAPMGTITTWDHHALVTCELRQQPTPTAAHVAAFLTSYYSGGGTASSCAEPVPTITCTARHALVSVVIDGSTWHVADIRLRMLKPRELATAQGFPASYILTGTQREQIARVGNSVSPAVAAAVVRSNLLPRTAKAA